MNPQRVCLYIFNKIVSLQLFIPFGRKQISRHVGSSTIPLAYLSYASPSFLEQELNEISLNSEAEVRGIIYNLV